MAIQDTDYFLLDDAGTSNKILAGKLKAGLTGTYANMKLLANKPDYSSRWVYCKDLQNNLAATDWMMVEIGTPRDTFTRGQSVKVSGTKVLQYFPSGPAGATGVITDSHSPGTPTETCETSLISEVDPSNPSSIVLTFPDNKGFDCFANGDVVQEVPGNPITTVDVYAAPAGAGGTSLPVGATFSMGLGDFRRTKNLGDTTLTTPTASGWVYDYKTNVAAGTGLRSKGNHGSSTAGYGLAYSNDGQNWTAFAENAYQGNSQYPMNNDVVIAPLPVPARYIAFYPWQFTSTWLDEVVYIKESSLPTVIDVKVTNIQPDATPPTITVDGGNWTGTNGSTSGTEPRDNKLVSTAPRLTVASLATPNFVDNESIRMVDDAGNTASYVPVTSTITSVNATNPAAIRLSFADPCPDLKFFQPQDVVQSVEQTASTVDLYKNDELRDGNQVGETIQITPQIFVQTRNPNVSSGLAASTWIIKAKGDNSAFPSGTPISSNFNFGGEGLNVGFSLYGSKDNINYECIYRDSPNAGYVFYTTTDSYTSLAVTANSLTNNFGDVFSLPATYTYLEPVRLISRDPIARTMVVDGGAWTGSDGTSSGDAADRETTVTGPSKSGTAKCDGIPASTTFKIKNSNGQWVDNTNRLGTSFYAKNASGRVSIARLLEVAIAEATTWTAATGYSEGAFVEHNGEYWYALSSNYDNSPDDNDPLDWLRLSSADQ